MNKSLQISRVSTTALSVALLISAALLSPHAFAATSTSPATPARPTIAGGPAGQNGGSGPGDEGSAADAARHAAMAKYQACITATGVKMPDFGGFGGGFGGGGFRNGARPTGAPTSAPTGAPTARPSRPALTAEQQAALNKCASLRPQFGGGFGRGGGPDDQGASHPLTPGAGTIVKKSAAPMTSAKPQAKSSSKPVTAANKSSTNTGMNSAKASASYIACLNKAGVNVKSASDISKLDQGSPKIAAALKSCAGK